MLLSRQHRGCHPSSNRTQDLLLSRQPTPLPRSVDALRPQRGGACGRRRDLTAASGKEGSEAFHDENDLDTFWCAEVVPRSGEDVLPPPPQKSAQVVPLGASFWTSGGACLAALGPLRRSLQEWRPFRARLVALEQVDNLFLSCEPTPSSGLLWPHSTSPSPAQPSPWSPPYPPSQPPPASPAPNTPKSSPPSPTPSPSPLQPPAQAGPQSPQKGWTDAKGGKAAQPPSPFASRGGAASSSSLRSSSSPTPGAVRKSGSGSKKDAPPQQQQQHGRQQQQQQRKAPAASRSNPTHQRTTPAHHSHPRAAPRSPTPISRPARQPLLGAGPASWAHLLTHPEPGCLLLAQEGPHMAFFDRSVILLTSHSESKGSVGFVLNKPSPMKVAELQLVSACPGFMTAFGAQRLQIGGPRHLDHATVLHRYLGLAGGSEVADRLYAGGLPDAVRMVQSGLAQPHEFHLMLGVAGWAPRQLEDEIARGMWHCVSASSDLVLPRRAPVPVACSGSGGLGDAAAMAKEGQDMWTRILAIAAGPGALPRQWM